MAPRLEQATFAAGCFWGIQAAFDKLEGVVKTTVGYTGGRTENPTYEQVCSGMTRHAEAVLVEYDSAVISYETLLDRFWTVHDPTTRDRQGPDIGSQYRSAILYHSPEQQQAALAAKQRLETSGRLRRPVVTEILPAGSFWPAEDYHQKFHEKHGGACNI